MRPTKIGEIRAFYYKESRDREADRLEKDGYKVDRYCGFGGTYYYKVVSLPYYRN